MKVFSQLNFCLLFPVGLLKPQRVPFNPEVQVKLQFSLFGAVLSFPLQTITCFLAIPAMSASIDRQGRTVSHRIMLC